MCSVESVDHLNICILYGIFVQICNANLYSGFQCVKPEDPYIVQVDLVVRAREIWEFAKCCIGNANILMIYRMEMFLKYKFMIGNVVFYALKKKLWLRILQKSKYVRFQVLISFSLFQIKSESSAHRRNAQVDLVVKTRGVWEFARCSRMQIAKLQTFHFLNFIFDCLSFFFCIWKWIDLFFLRK